MYVAQIKLPVINKDTVINRIFGLLHRNAYKVNRDYKYCLGLPNLSDKDLGTIMQVFSSDLNDLKKLLKTNGLYEIIVDYCNVKFVEVDLDFLKKKNVKSYVIKRTKDDSCISFSKIKRIIKRGNEKSEIVKKAKSGMSAKDIYDEIKNQKNSTKSYVMYKTTKGDNAVFFLSKEYCSKDVDFQKNVNSFGLSSDIVLPEIIF